MELRFKKKESISQAERSSREENMEGKEEEGQKCHTPWGRGRVAQVTVAEAHVHLLVVVLHIRAPET